jgi:hypothetical protein
MSQKVILTRFKTKGGYIVRYRRYRRVVSWEDYEATRQARRERERQEEAAREAQPQYAVCSAGTHGWFWVAWPSMPQPHFEGDDRVDPTPDINLPTWEGYAASEDAALLAATQTAGLPPFCGLSHGPGCHGSWHLQHRLRTFYATQILKRRATRRRLARTSTRTDAQQTRFVYEKYYHVSEYGDTPPYQYYTPHRVLRESARFVWVNTEPVSQEAWTQDHPEHLHTFRLDRQRLEAGEELYAGRHHYHTWVLHPPETAVDQDGEWRDYIVHTQPSTLAGAHPCLAALGLVTPCTVEDVTRAYRTLAHTAHPDTGGSHEAFLLLQANYEAALRLLNSVVA